MIRTRRNFDYRNVILSEMNFGGLPDLFYPCQEISGTAAASGLSGGANGTYSAGAGLALATPGPINRSPSVGFTTSSNNSMSAAIASNATNNITIECWHRLNSIAGVQCPIYYGNAGANGFGILSTYSGAAGHLSGLCGGINFQSTNTTLSTGVWHHLVMRRSSGTWSLWVDGVSQTITANGSQAPVAPIGSMWVGSDNFSSACPGGVAYAAHYAYALADDRIVYHYLAGLNGINRR